MAVLVVERVETARWPEEVGILQSHHQAKVIMVEHLTPMVQRLMEVVVVVVQIQAPELVQTVLLARVGQVERVQHHQLQDLL
jgi:hypothetical protein